MKVNTFVQPNAYVIFTSNNEEYAIAAHKIIDIKVASSGISTLSARHRKKDVKTYHLLDFNVNISHKRTAITEDTRILILNVNINGANVPAGIIIERIVDIMVIEDWQIGTPIIGKNKSDITRNIAVNKDRKIQIIDPLKLLVSYEKLESTLY